MLLFSLDHLLCSYRPLHTPYFFCGYTTNTTMDLSELRQEYSSGELDVESADPSPFRQFTLWFQQAQDAQILEPNAMVLSTVADGRPTQRTVLLKYFDEQGFTFFTNLGSRKATQLHDNPAASVLFPWYPLHRQVEIGGMVERVSTLESIKYFASRPRDSQIGAWVSQQSSIVSSRSLLQSKWEEMKKKFAGGEVPLPDFWGGFRIRPSRFEFWQGRPSRLHDRIEYGVDGKDWKRQRLSP